MFPTFSAPFQESMFCDIPLFENLSDMLPMERLFDMSPPDSPAYTTTPTPADEAAAAMDMPDVSEVTGPSEDEFMRALSDIKAEAHATDSLWGAGARASDWLLSSSVVAWVPGEPALDDLHCFDSMMNAFELDDETYTGAASHPIAPQPRTMAPTTAAAAAMGLSSSAATGSSSAAAMAAMAASSSFLSAAALAAAAASVGLPKKRKASLLGDDAGDRTPKKARATPVASRASSPAPDGADLLSKDDPEAKRHTHNVLERKRRNDLKTSYSALREQVPCLVDNDRAPTGQILLHAVEFINALQQEEDELLVALAGLRAENDRLRRDLGQL